MILSPLQSPPTQAEALSLHRQLCDADPVAPNAFAAAYLSPLLAWLAGINPHAPADFREEAAHLALVALIKTPTSYDASQLELFPYLRMSAQGDLKNLLQREAPHHEGRVDWESVEDSPAGRKYLGREDDPSLRLRLAEAVSARDDPAVAAVRARADEVERRVLELMLQGERRTPVYAEALGLADRPAAEQRREVKRLKDRLINRLKRERRET